MKSIEYCEKCNGNPYYVIKPGKGREYRCPKCDSYLREMYVLDDELRKKFIPMSVYLTLTEEQIQKRVAAFSKTSESTHEAQTLECTEKAALKVEVHEQVVEAKSEKAEEVCEYEKQPSEERNTDLSSMSVTTSLEANNTKDDRFAKQLSAKERTRPSYKEEVEEIYAGADAEQVAHKRALKGNNRSVYGRVQSISSDPGGYERPITAKLYEKIRYRQRMSDVHNKVKIEVLEEDDNRADCAPVEIIFHGNIEGGMDAFEQGGIIRAHGKMREEGRFYADALTYDGKTIRIAIERSDAAVVAVPIIIVLLFILLWQLIPDGMTFIQGIMYFKELIVRFFVWDVILTGSISMLLYIYTRRGVSALLRRLPAVPYSRCFWIGLAVSTVISALIVF